MVSVLARGCMAAGAFAALMLPAMAVARELRLSHQWPETDARHRASRVLAAELKRRTPELTIAIHPGSALVKDPVGQYQALIDGKIEMAVYPPTYLASRFPEMAIAGLPGVPANTDAASLLKGSPFEALLQQLCEERGFRFLTWWWVGGAIASRERPIKGPDTVKGLTVRGGADFARLLTAAGATVANMPSSQLRPAMESGKLDVVLSSLESLISFRIPEHTKHVTLGGFGLWIAFSPVIVSKQVWDGLTAPEHEALEQAAAASNVYFEASQRETEEDAAAAFKKAGAEVTPLTFEEYATWLRLARETSWKPYQSIGPAPAQLFTTLLQSFVAKGAPPKPAAGGGR